MATRVGGKRQSPMRTGRSLKQLVGTLRCDTGHVLLSSFAALLSASLLVSMLIVLANRIAAIETMNIAGDQAYWLAKSEAVALLKASQEGVNLPHNFAKKVPAGRFEGSQIAVSITQQAGGMETITVCATTVAARHTISFQYNPLTGKVANWMDSAQAP